MFSFYFVKIELRSSSQKLNLLLRFKLLFSSFSKETGVSEIIWSLGLHLLPLMYTENIKGGKKILDFAISSSVYLPAMVSRSEK